MHFMLGEEVQRTFKRDAIHRSLRCSEGMPVMVRASRERRPLKLGLRRIVRVTERAHTRQNACARIGKQCECQILVYEEPNGRRNQRDLVGKPIHLFLQS